MAINAHAPRLRPGSPSPGSPGPAQAHSSARGLAVWLQPGDGEDIDPAVWAQAAKAVLARSRRLAPHAEVLVWTAAGTVGVGDLDASDGGSEVSGTAHGGGDAPAAANPPVPLAGRRSIVAVDLATDTVLLDGVPVSFTDMERSLLRYFVENLSRPIQREELQRVLESLDCPGVGIRSIDVYIGRIRRKLGSARHAIATVRGGGYQFVPGPGSTVRGPAEYSI